MHDVIIVGGGPVGSYLASKLAEAGERVLVLERKSDIGERVCCTGIVSRECVQSFHIDEGLILRWLNSASIFSPSGKLVRLRREEPQACVLDRRAFNRAMAERAQQNGAEYRFGSQVKEIRCSEEEAWVSVVEKGEKLDFRARVIVLATGFGSNLTKKLGLGKSVDFALGAQVEVEINSDEVEIYLGRKVAPGFFAWLVPTSSHKGLVGLLTHRNPGFYLKGLISNLRREGKIVSVRSEVARHGVTLKPLSRSYDRRLIVVGDAAGQVKPITGGGIYYGLLSADIAADTLHQALKIDDLSSENLAAYERRWKQRLGQELLIDRYAHLLYERLGDGGIDKLFSFLTSTGIAEALLKAEDISFDWHAKAIVKALKVGGWSLVTKPLRIKYNNVN